MKAGDKAIVLNNKKWRHRFEIGSTVAFVEQETPEVYEFKGAVDGDEYDVQSQWLHPSEFQVIVPLEVGTKVRITGNGNPTHYFEIGSEATVQTVQRHTGSGNVNLVGKSATHGHTITQTVALNHFEVIGQEAREVEVVRGLAVGDRVVLVTDGGFVGEGFNPGTKGTIKTVRRDDEGEEIYSVVLDSEPHSCGDYGWTFVPGEIKLDTEVQPPPQKEKQVSTIQTEAKAPKVSAVLKTLYAVQDLAGSEVYIITEDRDEAREVKAAEGGKAYGVTIVQYKAVKEIR